MWSGFYLCYNERPKYAREMHGIIHSLNGGRLTFSLCLQLSFRLNFHNSETKKAASVWLSDLSEMRREGIVFVSGGCLSSYDTNIPSKQILLAQLNEFLDI